MGRIAAFLDLQGTLGGNGLDNINTFEFYPFSIEAIKQLNENNILAIVITNQSGIEKGELTLDEYENCLNKLKLEMSVHGAHFDAVYCCPHRMVDCACRKPKRGMIDMALEEFDIDISKSFVVGDMGASDMILAHNIGAKAILVLTGVGMGSSNEFRHTWQNVNADFIAENILEAVNYIQREASLHV